MKDVLAVRNFHLLCYAYFRCVDLSLDRLKWGTWTDFVLFFQNNFPPNKIQAILERYNQIINNDRGESLQIKRFKVFSIFAAEPLVEKNLSIDAFQLLDELGFFLTKKECSNDEAEAFRMKVSSFYLNELKSEISRKDSDMANSVEHYLQAPTIKTTPLVDFVR